MSTPSLAAYITYVNPAAIAPSGGSQQVISMPSNDALLTVTWEPSDDVLVVISGPRLPDVAREEGGVCFQARRVVPGTALRKGIARDRAGATAGRVLTRTR